ncbi:hypothetical protein PPL_08827 [Heterostelium album PN500]|uniref:DH domain-containing protein n=1 Tax=Heterostelium pallidum (strain ATCC 26659 / Pp 5 / PN500) TaxID=670386 RepID=D3BJU7_HETP5|nr:hypothetical protein PPL_08827 [Heterostelium album PN500]EFA78177.1 hypothetical protein PPL_08827 [Heterostelium album PN500]|eukprot:XP_020430303.1 hypothetical protein PPL_08827 [Heterostelium album PN500]
MMSISTTTTTIRAAESTRLSHHMLTYHHSITHSYLSTKPATRKMENEEQQEEDEDEEANNSPESTTSTTADQQKSTTKSKKKILTLRSFKKSKSSEKLNNQSESFDISSPTLMFSTSEQHSNSNQKPQEISPLSLFSQHQQQQQKHYLSPTSTSPASAMSPITLSPSPSSLGTPPIMTTITLHNNDNNNNGNSEQVSDGRPPVPKRNFTASPTTHSQTPAVPPRNNGLTRPVSPINNNNNHHQQPPPTAPRPLPTPSPPSNFTATTDGQQPKRMVNLRPVTPPLSNNHSNANAINNHNHNHNPNPNHRPVSQPPGAQQHPVIPPRTRIKSDTIVPNSSGSNGLSQKDNCNSQHENGSLLNGRTISLIGQDGGLSSPSTYSPNLRSNNSSGGSNSSGGELSSSDEAKRKTMRQKMLSRKTASLSLRDDDAPGTDDADADAEEYGSSYEMSPSSGSSSGSFSSFTTTTTSSSSPNDGSSMDINNNNNGSDVVSSPPTTSAAAATVQQKKRGFFSSKRSTVAVDYVDPKELIIEKLNCVEQVASRRSALPPIATSTTTNRVVKELIETEADYLDDLYILINYYKNSMIELSQHPSMSIKNEDINYVFSNVDELYVINLRLFNSLLEIIPNMENINNYPNVDEIFFKHTNALQRYVTYLSNQEQCNKQLVSWENNSQLSSILTHIKSLPGVKNQNISSYVIKPVQRLCKYPLLLRELKNTVPEENEHYRAFERAAKLMEKIVSDINGKIKNEEKINEIRDLIGKEHDSLLLKKTLLKEGKTKIFKKETGKSQDATLYLLDDIIIVYKSSILQKNRVVTIYLSNLLDIRDIETKEIKSGFEILHLCKEQAYRQSFSAENYADKLLWIRDIEDAVHAYQVITGQPMSNYT